MCLTPHSGFSLRRFVASGDKLTTTQPELLHEKLYRTVWNYTHQGPRHWLFEVVRTAIFREHTGLLLAENGAFFQNSLHQGTHSYQLQYPHHLPTTKLHRYGANYQTRLQ